VVIVSLDARNTHERADTVLVVPLTTSIHKSAPTHVFLTAGETGLQSDSAARAEDGGKGGPFDGVFVCRPGAGAALEFFHPLLRGHVQIGSSWLSGFTG
jgi:hypothetical protein